MEHANNFQAAPPRGVPSLAGPQTTLLERVTGRLTPDAAGQRTRSPHPRITEGRRVAVKSDYRMWISPELWGGPSGPSRQSEVQGGRGHPPATTTRPRPRARMWIAQPRRAPREGLPLLNIYPHPVGRRQGTLPHLRGPYSHSHHGNDLNPSKARP